MSRLYVSYDVINKIGNGAGEKQLFEDTSVNREKPNLSTIIAAEVVNEILENALDIAIGFNWTNPKSRPNSGISICYPSNNFEESNQGEEELNTTKESVCTDIVGDIIDRIGSSTPPSISELIDGLNSINMNTETNKDHQDLPLEKEMKQLLSEMMAPTYEIINYNSLPKKSGVGDQLSEAYKNEAIQNQDNFSIDTTVAKPVEKKSRVTDLVKNSPNIISKILMTDNNSKQTQDMWEETAEALLQVIELDHVKPNEESFRAYKKFAPENIPLPEDEELNLIQIPNHDTLDIIDLNNAAFTEEEALLELGCCPRCKVNQWEEKAGDSLSRINDNVNDYGGDCVVPDSSQMSIGLGDSAHTLERRIKKKRWNIGTRIWGFFKKSSKHQMQLSSPTKQK